MSFHKNPQIVATSPTPDQSPKFNTIRALINHLSGTRIGIEPPHANGFALVFSNIPIPEPRLYRRIYR